MKSAIYNSVDDPKNFQGNINNLTYEDKIKISNKADEVYDAGYEAYKIETEEKNQEKAINKWRTVFGENFPKYE